MQRTTSHEKVTSDKYNSIILIIEMMFAMYFSALKFVVVFIVSIVCAAEKDMTTATLLPPTVPIEAEIPAPHKLYVCGYVDARFDYNSTELPRSYVLRAFGALVTQALVSNNLRDTIGSEETSYGRRNVYDSRIHMQHFDDCYKNKLSAELANELAKYRANQVKEDTGLIRLFFNDQVLKHENRDELFKDIGDTKLSDAADDSLKRERVFGERMTALWFVFKKELEARLRASSSSSSRSTSDENIRMEAFVAAKKLYTDQRLAKKVKKDEQARRQADKKQKKEEVDAASRANKKQRKS